MIRGKDATLVAILNTILDEEPETQDHIANKLGISRRYVAKLIKPLIDDGIITHPYIINMNKISKLEIADKIDKPLDKIIELYGKMANNVLYNLDKTYTSLKNRDIEKAKGVIAQDYRLNKMEDEIAISIKMNNLKYLSMEQSMELSIIAANIERCGDYVSNIAEEIVNGLIITDNLSEDIDYLFEIITKMFNYAINRIENNSQNYEIYDLERELHNTIEKILEKISSEKCDNKNIQQYIQFGMFLKDVERFGDRSIKIFEAARDFYHNMKI